MSGISPFGSIGGSLSGIGTLTGTLTIPYETAGKHEVYDGEYEVTVTDETVILHTANKILKKDIVINIGSPTDPPVDPGDGDIATDEEVDDTIDDVFGDGDGNGSDSGTTDPEPEPNPGDIATDEEIDDMIGDIFG